MKRLLLVAAAAALASASAVAATPAGLWKTIDDNTGNVHSLSRITPVNGEYTGTIEKWFRAPDQDPNPKCDKCEGALKKTRPLPA